MNRDERLTREAALNPEVVQAGEQQALYPREQGGGTWIGSNSTGITFAILNRNAGTFNVPKLRSRGGVIPQLLRLGKISQTIATMERVELSGLLPFLLFAFIPDKGAVLQWTWDGRDLQTAKVGWRAHHWFSSGVSDALAIDVRGRHFHDAWRQRTAGSTEWLRGLHASHGPVRGSFSICVHRPDAGSVSYAEIEYQPPALTLRYHAGKPCHALGRFDCVTTIQVPAKSLIATAS